jgi:hypothetical protein
MHFPGGTLGADAESLVDATEVRIPQIVTRSATPKCFTFFIVLKVYFLKFNQVRQFEDDILYSLFHYFAYVVDSSLATVIVA